MMGTRRRLSRKYVVALVALVTGALLASGAVQLYTSYNESKAALVALQAEKARAAASRIETFVKEIERQLGWTTHPVASPAALDQRRQDSYRLQRQVQPITELSHLDSLGREQLRISRLAMEVVASQTDYSQDPRFLEAKKGRTYFGPVYFRKDSEPYMSIAMPQSGGGVTVAEINLKFILDVISQIKIGKAGLAYTVDRNGVLIAHPDISVVLQKTSLANLEQVKAALTPGHEPVTIARDPKGREVLTAHSTIGPLGWVVFVEQPLEEAFEPLRASARSTGILVVAGIVLSVVVSAFLGRRMARPIQVLQESAAKIGAGDLGHRIDLRSGDELETLADEFNQMTGRLRESYATLEQKVEDRTRELSESLEQQTATAEILRVISSSPTDVQPVFDSIAAKALDLCRATTGWVYRFDGELIHIAASHSLRPEAVEVVRRSYPMPPSREGATTRAVLSRTVVYIPDIREDTEYRLDALAQAAAYLSVLAVPMLLDGKPIGVLTVTGAEAGAFSPRQIALLQTFADQAVIAIENVRLFKELEEKNRTITEALEQQTSTAEILRVISSSPTDVQPVFATVLSSAVRLCGAQFGGVFRFEGGLVHFVTSHQWPPPQLEVVRQRFPMPPGDGSLAARAIRDRQVVQTADYMAEPGVQARWIGDNPERPRGTVAVPMLREGSPLGCIVLARGEPGLFSDEHLALLQTFADQAVIAIENVRLFKELEEKNRTITEALEQQTATAEILRVISSSPTDVKPVLEAVAETAARLCDANDAQIWQVEGDEIVVVTQYGPIPSYVPTRAPLDHEYIFARAVLERRVINLPDLAALVDTEYPAHKAAQARTGTRSLLAVPLLREGAGIGAVVIRRTQVRPFTDAQIALLQTFADQAVIAIENVRLFTELQSRTAELTRSVGELQALGEVGRAISSTLDLEVVLAAIVARANQLAETDGGAIYEFDAATQAFRLWATDRFPDDFVAALRATTLVYGEGAVGRAAATRAPVQVADVGDTHAYESRIRAALLRFGYRSLLAVPLVSEDEVVGALVVNRRVAGEFPPRIVELLSTFATQSALAIQNARLFSEIEDKGRQLEVANQHKSEFLASVSHELRTPLNAIIGFSEVMLERLFGEVNEKQEEYLQDILSSGRHLLSLINDILDLAKIEAGRMELEAGDFDLPQAIDDTLVLVRERALRRSITVERAVDPRLGEISGDERKIKQVLLNLLSNAVKFTPEGGRIDVRAAVANGTAEISVTDTGVGIAPEDHEAVFEEFRQVGTDYARKHEGTGLGLALARKFVELHGGRIWVKSQVGQGSTFTFTIPISRGHHGG
ncbi:MAG TPA: GAF domain-containing protein [Methylomirabilota bacterium]|nr:GAF domain-containing protein [Methylomirabilota bacterium]